jgi:hypothetical protein
MHISHKLLVITLSLFTTGISPAFASKCYGDPDCTACKNCNYCKNCNEGGTLCGVYYESRGETPPWKQKKKPPLKKPGK